MIDNANYGKKRQIHDPDPIKIETALREFVRDIDDTGGVVINHEGYLVPAIDEDWIDLGTTYKNACAALGISYEVSADPYNTDTDEEDGDDNDNG